MTITVGDFRFEIIENWGIGSKGKPFGGVVPSLAADSQDRVYIARRDPPAILVYDRDGAYLNTFADGLASNPHSVWIDADDRIFVADVGDHTVRVFTNSGEVTMTLGSPGVAGESGQPFNQPTWACLSPTGDIYVSDGYGQHRVHRFLPSGELIHSWGEEGAGSGQFSLPHGIRVDAQSRVLLLDREPNHRIQIFNLEGEFQTEWTGFEGPNDIYIHEDVIYVAEGGGVVSLLDLQGNPIGTLGEKGDRPGQFSDAPHGIWVDSHGDVYVAEVPHTPDRITKFARV